MTKKTVLFGLPGLRRGRCHSPPLHLPLVPPGQAPEANGISCWALSPSIIWLLCRVETPAAPRSSSRRGRRCRIDFWHFSLLPGRGRPPPLPTLLYFLLFCAFFKFRLHSRLSCPRQEKSHHRWNKMKQGSGATSTEKLSKLFFSRFESGQRAEREKDKKKKNMGHQRVFFFVFFSVQAPFLTSR